MCTLAEAILLEIRQEGYNLYGLAQTHLISENSIHFLLVHHRQPIETDYLIVCEV